MPDPATTALAVQMEYGDDELKKDIDERISEIVRREIRYYLNNNSFEIAQQVIVNNAGTFNSQVLRAMKDFMNNPRNIY